MTRRVMLDIETMSTDNYNALILSIGVVEWTHSQSGVSFASERLWLPDIREQLALGRGTQDHTLKWWREQSDAARTHWLRGEQCSILNLASDLTKMFEFGGEAWAHGIIFDLGNTGALLQQDGWALPWKYNAPMCARTFCRNTPQVRSRPEQAPGGSMGCAVAHDPVWDCKMQCWNVWEHWPVENFDPV